MTQNRKSRNAYLELLRPHAGLGGYEEVPLKLEFEWPEQLLQAREPRESSNVPRDCEICGMWGTPADLAAA